MPLATHPSNFLLKADKKPDDLIEAGVTQWNKILAGGSTPGVVYWQVTGKLGGVSPSRTLYIRINCSLTPILAWVGVKFPLSAS